MLQTTSGNVMAIICYYYPYLASDLALFISLLVLASDVGITWYFI